MFIDNVETVEAPEIVPSSALVWLESTDRFSCVWPQSLYYSSEFGFVFLGSVPDGKIDIIERTRLAGFDTDQLMSQMIQSRSGVVNSVPSDQRNFIVDGRNAHDFVCAITGVRVILEDDAIGVFPVKNTESFAEITEVLVGPI
jgi:hypothetical protein